MGEPVEPGSRLGEPERRLGEPRSRIGEPERRFWKVREEVSETWGAGFRDQESRIRELPVSVESILSLL